MVPKPIQEGSVITINYFSHGEDCKRVKIMVSGGAGFIGSHLVDSLLEKSHEVVICGNLEPQVHSNFFGYLNLNAEFIQADIRGKERLKRAIQDIDELFHQAAMVGVGQSMYLNHFVRSII